MFEIDTKNGKRYFEKDEYLDLIYLKDDKGNILGKFNSISIKGLEKGKIDQFIEATFKEGGDYTDITEAFYDLDGNKVSHDFNSIDVLQGGIH